MERLTFEGNFCDIAQCGHVKCPYKDGCSQKQVWERLKDYEDTGLTPEEIKKIGMETEAGCVRAIARMYAIDINRLRELAAAGRDEHVIVLPCKVGDTVYRLQYIEPTPGRFTVGVVPIKFALVWLEEFGKTVFLTREEAEKALREIQRKEDADGTNDRPE